MRTVYCYAHHGFVHGVFEYQNDFSGIPNNFEKLLSTRKQKGKKIKFSDEMVLDDFLGAVRNATLNQYCTLFIERDRFCLSNDEVFFLYGTGSKCTMRFSEMDEAKQYYIYIINKIYGIDVLDKIQYKDIDDELRIGDSFVLNVGYDVYHAGDLLRIFDYSKEEGWICPSPIEGLTLVNSPIPNHPWCKTWTGYDRIPVKYGKIISKGKIEVIHKKVSSEALF